jgi:putative tryptophan/tyrosine transport system substrate-binding protein
MSRVHRRQFVIAAGALFAAPLAAEAQQAGQIYRVGFLRVGPPPPTWIDGFRRGLRELDYFEGQNIVIEFGLAQDAAQIPDVLADLVRRKVSVILASGTPSVLPTKTAASAIPVVMVAAIDPVATGVATSLARPGGNVTGLTAIQTELIAKRFEMLKEVLPQISKIAVLVRADSPATGQYVTESEFAARSLGAQLQVLPVRTLGDFEEAFSAARGASALLHADDAVFTANRTQIAELALKNRLPTLSGVDVYVEAGGFMSYGTHYFDLYRRAAAYVDKILKGAKPADLPIEQAIKFELVINMRTAKALGLNIPPRVLARADRLIE